MISILTHPDRTDVVGVWHGGPYIDLHANDGDDRWPFADASPIPFDCLHVEPEDRNVTGVTERFHAWLLSDL